MPGLPTLTAPPSPPSRADDQDTFATKADAFLTWWTETFVPEFNSAIAAIPAIAAAINYNTTSTSSLLIATGNKTFTVPTNGLLQIGQFVVAASAANPANYMAGQVISHNATTGQLIVNVLLTGGSGTFADWIIAVTVPDQLTPVKSISITANGSDLNDNSTPLAKLTFATANSKLLGSGAAGSGAAYAELSIGSGLVITGTTLSVSGGTATLANGDYGDVTVSSSGTVITIDPQAVTYSKIQNVSATDKILGRSSAGAGVIEEITCTAAGRALIDDADASAQRTTLGLGSIAVMAEATAAQFWANTASKAISAATIWNAAVFQTLTDAVTVAVDMGAGFNFKLTIGGNRTLGNPTNTKEGQTGTIAITQDGTGNRTLAYASNWKFAGGTAPSLSTAAGARDILTYQVLPGGQIYASLAKNV